MANMKYLVAASITGAALLFTPLVISSSVDAKIETNRAILEQNGFKQVITDKSGYMTAQRHFTLEVTDGAKARDYLLDMLVAKNTQYRFFATSLKEISPIEMNSLFNGLTFKGVMENSNLLPQESTMSLVLEKLPLSIHKEVADNKEFQNTLVPLLQKGAIAFDLRFDSRQKLSNVRMRDIKESLKFEEAIVDMETRNHAVSFNDDGNLVKGKATVDKQMIDLRSSNFELQSNLDKLIYEFIYKNEFNNQGTLSLGGYQLSIREGSDIMALYLGKMEANSALEEIQQGLTLKAMYTLNDIAFADKRDEVKLKKMIVNIDLSGIATAKIKKLQEDYNALMLEQNSLSDEELINDFVALINDGMALDLSVKLSDLSAEVALKDMSIDLNMIIPKNTYSDKQSPLALLSLLEIKANVKMHKDDRQTLENFEMSAEEDFASGKVEGDYFIYDILFKDNKISINGKAIN